MKGLEELKSNQNNDSEIEYSFSGETLIDYAKFELEKIKWSLGDFIKRVIEDEPDVIVFLDKGARIFGTPIKKYLEYIGINKMPEIHFFNDDFLKKSYLNDKLTKEVIMEELGFLKDKKVFFFDEIFAQGTGASALRQVKNSMGWENLYYFAIGYYDRVDSSGDREESDKKWRKRTEIMKDKNFKIYPNEFRGTLFSQRESYRYVSEIETDGRKKTIHRTKRDFLDGEKDQRRDENITNFRIIAELKKMIFKTLKTLNAESKP